jgi:DNA-binding MarR family transcriptional regulator
MGFARSTSDVVVFMDHGQVVESGPPEQIFEGAETDRLRPIFGASFVRSIDARSLVAASDRLDWRIMVETESQVGELAGELQRVLSKVFSVLRRGDTNRTDAGDLTLAQLSILLTLLDQGPIRMTELAAHERVRTPTTTVAIRRLEKLGLVKRSRDPSDLRAVLVDITPKGLAQHREALAARRAQLARLLAKLSPEDLETLTRALVPLERLTD